MSPLASRRPRLSLRLASFAVPLFLLAFVTGSASAEWPKAFQRYSERWYGQNFYDGQRNGVFLSRGQHTAGFYGPAMMYGRQYDDEYGYRTSRPFRPARPYTSGEGSSYGPDPFTRH